MSQTSAPDPGADHGVWPTVLGQIGACPRCRTPLDLDRSVRCESCGFAGQRTEGVANMVAPEWISDSHETEVAAQTAAVDDYYENEDKLTCHWDRLSAAELPALLGWPSGVALDLGCGTGTAGAGIRHSGLQVIGADLSPACLQVARRRLDAVVRVEGGHLPFRDGSIDTVVSRGCLHHLQDPEATLAELKRVMAPGAKALFMDPREYAWLEPIKHALRRDDDSFTDDHHGYTPAGYRALIEECFEVQRSFTWYPAAVLAAHGLDLLPIPRAIPRRGLAKALLELDRGLNRTLFARYGHLVGIVARRAP